MADKIPWYLRDNPVRRVSRSKVEYSIWLIVPGVGRTNRLHATSRGEKVAIKMAKAPYLWLEEKHGQSIVVESVTPRGAA